MGKPHCVRTALLVAVFLFLLSGASVSYASGDWNDGGERGYYNDRGHSFCDRFNGWWGRFNFCKDREGKRPPLVYLFATKYSIKAGKSTNLYWDAKRALTCTAEGSGWSGERAVKAEETVSPAITTTYTITCSNEFGSYTDSATITVKGKADNPPTPVDICSNIDGIQEIVPSGYHLENNQCVEDTPPPVDVCLNIEGVQESIPSGYHIENDSCVPDVLPPVDVCPNLDGVQESVPAGYHTEGENCIQDEIPPIDVCPNIEGVQETIPEGYHLDGDACVQDEEPPVGLDHLLISEVFYRGASTNEWVEIHNSTGGDVTLNGWTISDAVSSDIIPTATIPNGGFAVIVGSTVDTTLLSIPVEAQILTLANSTIGSGLNDTGDAVFLKNGDVVVDSVSYDSNTDAFSPSVAGVVAGHSIYRTDVGVDTDTALDWADGATPTPGSGGVSPI